MAMNECQKMAKDDLYKSIRNVCATYRNYHDRLVQAAEWLANADATTYSEIDATTLTDIAALRTAINGHLAATETAALLTAINKIRYMS